jgi:Putative transmembrane protein (PGPGW)
VVRSSAIGLAPTLASGMLERVRRHLRRAGVTVAGGILLLAGAAMLVLPGPGLLVVLAGLLVLASEYPAVERFVDPVRDKALQAADESVETPLRMAGALLGVAALLAAGIVWIYDPWGVPFGGVGVGVGLLLSGLAALALLAYSYRRRQQRQNG